LAWPPSYGARQKQKEACARKSPCAITSDARTGPIRELGVVPAPSPDAPCSLSVRRPPLQQAAQAGTAAQEELSRHNTAMLSNWSTTMANNTINLMHAMSGRPSAPAISRNCLSLRGAHLTRCRNPGDRTGHSARETNPGGFCHARSRPDRVATPAHNDGRVKCRHELDRMVGMSSPALAMLAIPEEGPPEADTTGAVAPSGSRFSLPHQQHGC